MVPMTLMPERLDHKPIFSSEMTFTCTTLEIYIILSQK